MNNTNVVIEKNYKRFEAVGQGDICEVCPSACKTMCARKLAQTTDNEISYFTSSEEEYEVEGKH